MSRNPLGSKWSSAKNEDRNLKLQSVTLTADEIALIDKLKDSFDVPARGRVVAAAVNVLSRLTPEGIRAAIAEVSDLDASLPPKKRAKKRA